LAASGDRGMKTKEEKIEKSETRDSEVFDGKKKERELE
jgi:hypothetical protein